MTIMTGSSSVSRRVDEKFDVIVAGGGSAGVAAAAAAARAGARTLLIEKAACLGGAATLRNVVTYCGLYEREHGRQVVHGFADEVLTGLRQLDAAEATLVKLGCAPGPRIPAPTGELFYAMHPDGVSAEYLQFAPELVETVIDERR